MPRRNIREVLKKHTDSLMSIPGVVGTAQGESKGKPCLKVFVTQKTKEIMRMIPSKIEGYAVRIEESGTFKALGSQ
jgi:hypothetical protein